MATTEGRVARPEWRCGCRCGTPVGCSQIVVQFSSTTVTYNAGLEPVTTVMRWDQKAHKHVNVNCPASSHCEGIQRTHCQSRCVWHVNRLSLYKVDHKSTKWYRHIFFCALNVAIINGCVIIDVVSSCSNPLVFSKILWSSLQPSVRL